MRQLLASSSYSFIRHLACAAAVAATTLGLTFAANAAPEKRVALVVGNATYQDVPTLANPVTDAKAVSAALKRLGFEVVEGYDLKNDAMRTTLGEFAAKLDGAKAALVYYAGHGVAVGDENYLLPTDAVLKSEADLDFRTVNVNLVLRQMQREERVNILILDACRDNPFTKELARSVAANSKNRTRSVDVSSGLGAMDTQATSGILIAFATDPRSVALDGSGGGNSPFTSALLKHMETPGVSISTVMDRVREDVWTATDKKQKPWVNTSIIGEFMLNPAAKVAALPPSGDSLRSDASRQSVGQGLDRAQMDVKMWESAEKANTAEDYQAYLDAFPTGQFAQFAKNRIAKFKAAAILATKEQSSEDELKLAGSSKTENVIGLDNETRRQINMRLKAIGFDPGAVNGKFGPASRRAIAQWQNSRQFPATGYLTSAQKVTLETQSEEAYQLALSTPSEPAPTVTRNVSRRERTSVRTRTVESDEAPVVRRRQAVRSDGGGGGGGINAAQVGAAISILGAMRGGRGGGIRFGF
jgi:uncharacterized caspase-like protein